MTKSSNETIIKTENIQDELEIFIKTSISVILKQLWCVEKSKSSKLPSVNASL